MHHTITEGKTIQQSGWKIIATDRGFTLVEIMTVLVIISILALFAAPEVTNWRPKLRLKSAADALSENMQRAKMHAIKNNVSVVFKFTKGTGTPCKGGTYKFTESLTVTNVVADVTLTDNVCLSDSDFGAGDGFTSRGLPINSAERYIKLRNADLSATGDPEYKITQSIAGGIILLKDKI